MSLSNRFVEITEEDDLSEEWKSVVQGRPFSDIVAFDHDFGEGATALILFEDGSFEVGRGEPLRPYTVLYAGKNEWRAWEEFLHAFLDTIPSNGAV